MDKVKLIDELTREEALRLTVYDDATGQPLRPGMVLKGYPTIGIGRNLVAGISRDEAYHLVHNDIDKVEAALNDNHPWWQRLDEVRQRVLADMCFNLGIRKLNGFVHMLALVETGDYDAAADHMQHSDWYKQVGPRAERLIKAMRSGVMP